VFSTLAPIPPSAHTAPPASAATGRLEELGIVRETTGRTYGRRFVYDAYLTRLSRKDDDRDTVRTRATMVSAPPWMPADRTGVGGLGVDTDVAEKPVDDRFARGEQRRSRCGQVMA
jgi:hypothetical protein